MIPGQLVALFTFPGVIVHEIAHQLFCRWFRVAIFDVCYFRFGNPAGYVIHEHPRKPLQNVLIAVGPFLINTILGAVIAAPAVIPIHFEGAGPIDWVLGWLGFSIAMHAFPSTGDANSMLQSVTGGGKRSPALILVAPLVALIYLGAIGSVFWLDAIYGLAVVAGIPRLIVSALA